MYNISDLNAMSENELKTIAESMGLKKVDPTQKDDLIYRILDQQAIVMASTTVVEKKRRGPKPKKEKEATEENNSEGEKTIATRKKKKQSDEQPKQEQPTPVEEVKEEVVNKEEVDAASAQETIQEAEVAPKERRRRNRISETATEIVALKENQPTNDSVVSVVEDDKDDYTMLPPLPKDVPAEVKEEVVETAQKEVDAEKSTNKVEETVNVEGAADKVNEPQAIKPKDSSFGSFFPRGEGRRFVPRSQREKEEAAAAAARAAATAPIMIGEPGQESQQPQQQNNQNQHRKLRFISL